MAAIMDTIQDAFLTWVDPSEKWRASPTLDWPMAKLTTALPIALAYLAMVIVGPRLMADRKPFSFYGLRFAYNMMQIALSAYMAVEAMIICYRHSYSILPCEPYSVTNPVAANVIWLFYLTKVFDFMDTFLIITGKKWNQLSFLHVYHHLTMFLVCWMCMNVGYDGDANITVLLNASIHTVMYTYYFVSLHTNNIWWKSSLTMCQLIQFCGMMYQGVGIVVSGCQSYPKNAAVLNTAFVMSLFALFSDFYIRSYSKPSKNASNDLKKQA